MAKIRIGFSTHFEVENELVGIGTDNPTNTKQVLGNIHATNAKAIGVSTLATYQGFLDKEARFGKSVIDINSQAGTLGEIVIDGDVTVSSGSTLCSGVDELSLTDSFSVPTGNTDSRIHCQTAGSMRFNEDFGTLEFYTGDEWRTVNSFKDTGNRGRGVFFAGSNPSPSSVDLFSMEYITIASLGNSIDFGVLENDPRDPAAFSSSVRGFAAGGDPPPNGTVTDKIEYFTIASEGNAIDFGNLTDDRRSCCGNSSSTRGIVAGGYDDQSSANVNVIDYIEMSTVGNALDFGDLTRTERANSGGSNGVRAIFAGGWGSPGTSTVDKDINMLTISSKGDAVKFGELTRRKSTHAGGSNSVRCIFAGGYMFFDTSVKTIDYITISSEGNATNFGELITRRMSVTDGSAVNSTRFVLGGGHDYFPAGNSNGVTNSMEFITIASTGGGQDFGDLSSGQVVNRRACSDSHGGLGGF